MSRREFPIALVDLEHAPADEHRTLVRVLARVAAELGAPAQAELLVSRAAAPWLSFPARAWEAEETGDWRGVFAVPAALLARSEFGFALATGGHVLPLPHPGFGTLPALSADQVARLTSGRLRTRAVALATAIAVTASSTPAVALAGSGGLSSPTAPGHAQASRDRIEQLALFAVERARAQARGERALATTGTDRSTSSRHPAVRGGLAGQRSVQGAQRATAHRATVGTGRRARAESKLSACVHPMAVIATVGTHHRVLHCGALTGSLNGTATATGAPPATGATPVSGGAPVGPAPTPGSPPTTGTPPPTGTTPTAPTTGTPPTGTPPTTGTTPTTGTPPTTTGTAPTTGTTPGAPPRLLASGREQRSHPQLPIRLPRRTASGGAILHPVTGGHAVTGGAGGTLSQTPPGFLGPTSWTGTVVTNPALEGVLGNLAAELHDISRPPRFLIPVYMEAARRYHVPWQVLAAINSVETDYGRNLDTSSAGAIGWMQFEPSTWKQWGVAVDGHNVANPYDPRDAVFSAARYLAAAGAASDISRAIYAYNHATWYVDMVLSRARAIAAAVHPYTHTNPRGIISTFFTAWRGQWHSRFNGGYLTHYTRLIAAANMVSAADFHYAWGGGHEQPARFGPFDCSGSVSYVLQQAGYTVPTVVSGNVASWRFPSGPGKVTIFYNSTHTFMRIGDRYFGTSTMRPGGGAGWIATDKLPADYLAGFHEVHAPWLHGDAFAARHHRHQGGAARPTRPHRTSTRPTPSRLTPFPAGLLQFSFPAA